MKIDVYIYIYILYDFSYNLLGDFVMLILFSNL